MLSIRKDGPNRSYVFVTCSVSAQLLTWVEQKIANLAK
jgi:hypothetical protein